VLHLLERLREESGQEQLDAAVVTNVAAAFEDSVVDVLVTKTAAAAESLGVRQAVLAGGVAANLELRRRLAERLRPRDVVLSYPPVAFCTDNAAMIAGAAYFHLSLGQRDSFALDVEPGLQLPFATVDAAESTLSAN
jgi:N6-L-threonylcarbamoyladenine synthase